MNRETIRLPEGQAFALIRARRRTMAIRVTEDGNVVVRVPLVTPLSSATKFVQEHLPWIEKQQKKMSTRAPLPQPTKEELENLLAFLNLKMPEYAALLGVHYQSVRLTSAKKRWGSCTPKTGSICFSKYLALCPPAAVEYVVVHELTHLRYPNHSKIFRETIKQILPDAEIRQKMLRRIENGEKTE